MTESEKAAALRACEALCTAYVRHADAGEADALAHLYTTDGVFDRLGQKFEGHAAISGVIASRPPGVWTQHHCRNVRIELDADGQSARGQVDLELQRGRAGATEYETVRAVYDDRFVLTDEGWRFALRKVTLAP